ncbi:MAG: hypothetical protein ACTSQ4_08350 [Candidatus Heimdallarchaeaceae archaeon]
MKIRFKIAIILLFISLFLSSTYSLKATVEDKPSPIRGLNADSTPPIIIFNITQMSTDNIIKILVYDAESNLTEVTPLGSTSSFNVTWSYLNYTLFPPPLSKGGETIPAPTEPEANTFDADVSTDLFVVGEHNNITVDAENEELLASTSSITFCNSYECWGRGGGQTSALSETTLNVREGVPLIHFDLTGYYCCGCIDIEIIPNDAEIVDVMRGLIADDTILVVEVTTTGGDFYKSALVLDPEVTLESIIGCEDCTCPTDISAIPGLIALLSVATVIILLKRKRKV